MKILGSPQAVCWSQEPLNKPGLPKKNYTFTTTIIFSQPSLTQIN